MAQLQSMGTPLRRIYYITEKNKRWVSRSLSSQNPFSKYKSGSVVEILGKSDGKRIYIRDLGHGGNKEAGRGIEF